jgi:ribosomal protein S18 acetylase RimI-like enzyme
LKAFREYREYKWRWFDKTYGEKQWSLLTLATHPDYRKGGVGTALCWGIQKAISDKLEPVTLFASPLGKRLYNKLGFKEVGVAHIQVPGEEEFLKLPGMTLDLERDRSMFGLPQTFEFKEGSLGKIICTLAQS